MTVRFTKAKGRFRTIITDGLDPDETPDIINLSGKVTLTPNVTHIVDETDPDGGFYGASPFIGEVRDGILSTPGQPQGYLWLVSTDNPDFNPANWKYNVVFDLKTPDGRQITIPNITIAAPAGEELNLSRLVPAANSPTVGTALAEAAALRAEAALAASVRSVNGTTPDDAGNVLIVPQPPTGGWSAISLAQAVRDSLALADGAVPGSLAAVGQVFGRSSSGLTGISFAQTATAGTLVQRDGNGNVLVATTPLSAASATSKGYTDTTFALVGRAVATGTGLTGGGTLAADRTIALTAASIASLLKADTAVQPAALTSGLAGKADLVGGLVPTSQIPAVAINDTFVVGTEAAMLALTAQRGDIAKRTDLNGRAFVLAADAPGTLANWVDLGVTVGVQTINGQSNIVVLGAADVGAVALTQAGNSQVYAKGSTGTLIGVGYGTGATANALVQRNSSGQVTVPTPSSTSDATSKDYVDTRSAALIDGARLGGLSASITGQDMNLVTASGFYSGNTTTNGPLGTDIRFYFLLVHSHTTNTQWRYQRATEYATAAGVAITPARTWERVLQNSNWSAWVQITDGNASPTMAQLTDRAGDKTVTDNASAPTAITVDGAQSKTARRVLTGNVTVSMSQVPAAGFAFSNTLVLVQDATGGRTVTWPAGIKWPGGVKPTLSTAPNAIDAVTLFWTGTEWIGFLSGVAFA